MPYQRKFGRYFRVTKGRDFMYWDVMSSGKWNQWDVMSIRKWNQWDVMSIRKWNQWDVMSSRKCNEISCQLEGEINEMSCQLERERVGCHVNLWCDGCIGVFYRTNDVFGSKMAREMLRFTIETAEWFDAKVESARRRVWAMSALFSRYVCAALVLVRVATVVWASRSGNQ